VIKNLNFQCKSPVAQISATPTYGRTIDQRSKSL
jgi:hypothetical protein